MATTPLQQPARPAAPGEIRGAALVAHIEAQLAAHEAAQRPATPPMTPDA